MPMKQYRTLNRPSRIPRVLTLGVFDGLHRGHQLLLKRVIRIAKQCGYQAGIITFNDHPQTTLDPDKRPPRLISSQQQVERLAMAGMSEVFVVPFTSQLARMNAADFVESILVRTMNMRHIVVGEDFVFGSGASGDIALLKQLGRKLGFSVSVVRPLRDHGTVISSTGIRFKITAGDMSRANRWLGYPYALHGSVVHGAHRGRRFGLPTANLAPYHELIPADGIYAVVVELRSEKRLALCHIGRRPTFETNDLTTIEVYIPGWRGNLYRHRLTIHFLARIRGVLFFPDPQLLLKRIERDWEAAKSVKPAGVSAPACCFVKTEKLIKKDAQQKKRIKKV